MVWVKVGLDIAELRATRLPMYENAPEDWGTPEFYHRTYLEIAILGLLFVLAILPNRWLVFSPIAFVISLLIALIPWVVLFSSFKEWSDLLWMMPLLGFFGLLPASLILSFWRGRKGRKIGYV